MSQTSTLATMLRIPRRRESIEKIKKNDNTINCWNSWLQYCRPVLNKNYIDYIQNAIFIFTMLYFSTEIRTNDFHFGLSDLPISAVCKESFSTVSRTFNSLVLNLQFLTCCLRGYLWNAALIKANMIQKFLGYKWCLGTFTISWKTYCFWFLLSALNCQVTCDFTKCVLKYFLLPAIEIILLNSSTYHLTR